MLNDVAGKPLYALGQPRSSAPHNATTRCAGRPRSICRKAPDRSCWSARRCTARARPNAAASNLRGKVVSVFDGAGVVTSDDYDFKGNLLAQQPAARRRLQEHAGLVRRPWRWRRKSSPASTTFDALNRPRDADHAGQQRHPPGIQRGQSAGTGRRQSARRDAERSNRCGRPSSPTSTTTPRASASGSSTATASRTTYDYDPLTFRLLHLQTLTARQRAPARPVLHLRPGGQHHPHPRRRAADDLLPQPRRSSRATTTPTTRSIS